MYYDVQINMSYMYRNKMYFQYLSNINIPSFRIVILSLHKTNFDDEAGGGIEPVQILIIKIKYKIALHATALLFLLVTDNTMREFQFQWIFIFFGLSIE